jgi:C4-dicarboxylate-specific signal transduction histidine kinase
VIGEVEALIDQGVDTDRPVAAEDALGAAQSELGRVARLTTVGAMAATIAHEINQPLAAIVANGSIVGTQISKRLDRRLGA